jgi:hypothetical protein
VSLRSRETRDKTTLSPTGNAVWCHSHRRFESRPLRCHFESANQEVIELKNQAALWVQMLWANSALIC